MVYVTPGSFLMGSPEKELERNAMREQQHEVTISQGYWMATFETSQKVWQKIMKYNPSKIKNEQHPVESVSWNEVQEFISKANKNDGKFRLPYEAEWEYACRAGTTTSYAGHRDLMTWHRGNASATTHPVDSKKSNAWGLHNMHGNVGEWCQDWFTEDISKYNLDPKGPVEGDRKIQRGGQYTGRVRHTRSADRSSSQPSTASFFAGFRLVHD